MNKIIFSSNQARKKILKGLNLAANTIAITAGPKGRNVILEQKNDLAPLIINDGARIAKDISLIDPVENLGAAIIKQVAMATNAAVGDGTTTATILTQAITNASFNALITNKVNPIMIKNGINSGVKETLLILKKHSKKISQFEDIAAVAKIASGNEKIGHLIATAYNTVGCDGIVNVEMSQTFNSSLEITTGFEFNGGYLSRYMLDELNASEINWYQTKILVFNQKLNSLKPIIHLLEECSKQKIQLVIIAQDFSDEIISALAINKMKKILDVIAIKPINYFSQLQDLLTDLCYVIDQPIYYLDDDLNQLKIEQIKTIHQIKISKQKTIIIHTLENQNNLKNHIKSLQNKQQEYLASSCEFNELIYRIAALEAKVGLIKIGGETEIEQQEKKYRVEDALHATQQALKFGVISGAGMGFYYASEQLNFMLKNQEQDHDFLLGIKIIQQALKAPAIQILINAGVFELSEINESFYKKLTPPDPWSYLDFISKTFVNSWDAKIIDPYQVCAMALLKASSIATTLITTEAVIVNAREKRKFVFPDL